MHRSIAAEKGYISEREYEDSNYVVFFAEDIDDGKKLNCKTSPLMLLTGGFGDEITGMREVAFMLYGSLVSEPARLEMRDLFLTGHEYGKQFYLLNTIASYNIVDSYYESSAVLAGEMVLYSTAQQCLDFINKCVYADEDEVYAVNIINISRVNTDANIRKFIGMPCMIERNL